MQRLSVILTDAVLYGAAWFWTRKYKEPMRNVAMLLAVTNAGLLIVDHIHFQYNGLLLGKQQTYAAHCKMLLSGIHWEGKGSDLQANMGNGVLI